MTGSDLAALDLAALKRRRLELIFELHELELLEPDAGGMDGPPPS